MPVLSAGIIRNLCVVLVGKDEQERIIKAFAESEKYTLQSVDCLGKLQSLKSGLMHDLLTGKVRVNDTKNLIFTPESLWTPLN